MLILLILLFSVAHAEEKSVCATLSIANDILECVKSRSPELQRLNAEKDALINQSKATKRWINPEISNVL
jgi:hypothetical protein